MRWFSYLALALPLALGFPEVSLQSAPPVAAAKNEGEPGGKGGKAKEKDRIAVTPEREAAVKMFVKQHHPELGDLLTHLHSKNSKEYERAVRELFRISEQLALFKDRDGVRYDLELRLWKVKSRLQLLSARLRMGGNESLQADLKAALGERFDLEAALFQHEHKLLAERVEKLENHIARLKANRENTVEQQFQSFTNMGKTSELPKPRPGEKSATKASEQSVEVVAPPALKNPAPK